MLTTLKNTAIKVLSYFKPVNLGLHSSLDSGLDDPIATDQMLDFIRNEVEAVLKEKTSTKFTTIKLDGEILATLNPRLGTFTVESMSVANKANSSIVKLKQVATGKTVRISLQTFRLFFTSKK